VFNMRRRELCSRPALRARAPVILYDRGIYTTVDLPGFNCSAEHFQRSAEFLPLRNRGLGPLAVAILPIPFAKRVAATAGAAVQPAASLFVAGDRQGFRLLVRAPH
jgi:hypothetical protein